jgi:hypothetical protein
MTCGADIVGLRCLDLDHQRHWIGVFTPNTAVRLRPLSPRHWPVFPYPAGPALAAGRRGSASPRRPRAPTIPALSRRGADWQSGNRACQPVLDDMSGVAKAGVARGNGLVEQALAEDPASPLAPFAKAQLLRAQHHCEAAIPEYETVWPTSHGTTGRMNQECLFSTEGV